jgi:hypothetical protein
MRGQLSASRSTWQHYVWVLPFVLGTVVIGFLCWGGWFYGYDPHWLSNSHEWWQSALQPKRNLTLSITLTLFLAGLICYWWPRRRQRVPIGLIVVVVMVVVAAALGTASLVPCRNGISTIGVLFWVLQLYVGQPPPAYPSGAAMCSGSPPLALQLGQGIGLGATLIGAIAVGTVLWQQPVERLRSRFARKATVFTGLDQLTLPLLMRLADPAARRNVIVIEPDETHSLLDEARAAGARVIIGPPAAARLLQPIVSGWRGCALDHLYALRSDVAENEAVLDTTREILRRYPPDAEHHPHLVARIDDPRHANHWRGGHGGTVSAGFEDALSPAETTAFTLIDALLNTSVRKLIVCGDTRLTLAILLELDRRGWEQRELLLAATRGQEALSAAVPAASSAVLSEAGDGGYPLPPTLSVSDVVLIDPRADDMRHEFLVSRPRTVSESAVTTSVAPWQDDLLPTLAALPEAVAECTAVIIVDSFSEVSMHAAGRAARLHPNTWIYMQAASGGSVNKAIFDRLRFFQSGLLIAGDIPEDTWIRVARHWHECFRLEYPVPPDHPKAPSRRRWTALTDYVRHDNLLQVRSILSAVADLGRQWVPVRMVPTGSYIELSEAELQAVAMAEHTRWYRRRLATKRSTRGITVTGSFMMPWTELSADEHASRRAVVRSQVAQLENVGFVPVIPAGGPAGSVSCERVGTVEAIQLSTRYSWLIRPGEELHGEAGDWRVIDEYDQERTVGDAEFQAAHSYLGDGRWRRTGTFRAWEVHEALVLRTKEGVATASPGDWVVEGSHGERWPVSDRQFKRSYRLIPDGPDLTGQASTPAATSSSTAPAISS